VETKSPKTISFYRDILRNFQWYLNKFNIETIDATTIRSFLGYVKDTVNRWDSTNTRANRMVSPTTVKSYYVALSVLFNWAVREHNPMATVKKPKLQQKTVKGLDKELILQLISSLNGRDIRTLRNKTMLYIFLDTGLRLSELANLKMSDIDLQTGIIKTNGRGNKERFARIGIKTQKALWSYIAHRPVDTEYVWQGKDNNKMATDSIAQMIRNLGKKNGIRLSPHKLRH
jgi:site-specific recombinase XerD